ncbi:hypothetical protein PIB30_046185 [Stylosanthes scabra]|uniref:Uncharacterized protein n=1 Tax=Stylosanthes scabra TaxID=79078 RepID=A0ABU6XGN1_9FABA|nr:hypothetical protein [Stylosanthes scabra]
MAIRHELIPESTAKSNMETAKAILANPAMINRSLSLGIAAMSSSQVDYTPLGHETNPVLISEVEVEDEGPFTVPTPEAGDLIFLDDEFNLDSILSKAHEVFSKAFPKSSLEKPKTEDASNFESVDPSENKEDSHPEDASKSQGFDPELILKKVNQILACLNYSLEEIVANAEIKAQLLEATTFLNQYASSEAGSLETFMEDLFNSNNLLESSFKELLHATTELAKQKKEVTKCDQAISKVKPMLEMGSTREEEVESAKKIKATNSNLKAKLSKFEEMKASNHSKCAATVKAMEKDEAKHKQAVEASTRLSRRKEELKLAFRAFLKRTPISPQNLAKGVMPIPGLSTHMLFNQADDSLVHSFDLTICLSIIRG